MKKLGWFLIIIVFLLIPSTVYAAPRLYSPGNNRILVTNSYTYLVDFMYDDSNYADTYYLYAEVSTSPGTHLLDGYFTTVVAKKTVSNDYHSLPMLPIHWYKSLPTGIYYWHVLSTYEKYGEQYQEWSDIYVFAIVKPLRVANSFHKKICKNNKKYHAKHCKIQAKHKKKCTKIIYK